MYGEIGYIQENPVFHKTRFVFYKLLIFRVL